MYSTYIHNIDTARAMIGSWQGPAPLSTTRDADRRRALDLVVPESRVETVTEVLNEIASYDEARHLRLLILPGLICHTNKGSRAILARGNMWSERCYGVIPGE